MKTTITEALAELKLIEKKISKKQEDVLNNVFRMSHLDDPYANTGGSEKYVAEQNQSVHDLRERRIKIRAAIMKSNVESSLTIGDKTRTVTEWLTWKREVATSALHYEKAILSKLSAGASNRPQVYKNDKNEDTLVKIVLHFDAKTHSERAEKIQEHLDKLDGALSLFNATTTIEI